VLASKAFFLQESHYSIAGLPLGPDEIK